MQDRDTGMDDLDALFAAARATPAQPTDDLMARILSDAVALQPPPLVIAPSPVATPVATKGLLSRLAEIFGGFGALAGMGSAAAAGLFIGFAQPAGLSGLSAMLMGGQIESLSLMPSVDDLIAEVTP